MLRLKCPKNKHILRISLFWGKLYVYYVKAHFQLTFTCSKSTIETVEKVNVSCVVKKNNITYPNFLLTFSFNKQKSTKYVLYESSKAREINK